MSTRSGHFELFRSPKDGQFYWRLKAANGEPILQSEGYTTKQGALDGIESVRKNAPIDNQYKRAVAKNGQYFFVLRAANNRVIGVSEMYTTKASRDAGVESVKQTAPCAPVKDLTLSEEERKRQAEQLGQAQSLGGLYISTEHCKEPIQVKPKGGVYGSHKKTTLTPHKQKEAFRILEEGKFITKLVFRKGLRDRFIWEFNLGEIIFLIGRGAVKFDYSHYRLKVVHSPKVEPRVYMVSPRLPKGTKHVYKEGHLCLYKPSNWQWQNHHRFNVDIFPNLCAWIYHYEYWSDTGEWIGPEAFHGPSPTQILNFLNRRRYGRA